MTVMRYLMFLTGAAVAAAVFVATTPAPRAQGFSAPAGSVDAPDPGIPLYFEAASVKPSDPKAAPGGGIRRQPGGRFNTFNTPLRQLIIFAYQIQGYQLVGGPDWIDGARDDITAKFEGDPPPIRPGTGADQSPPVAVRLLRPLAPAPSAACRSFRDACGSAGIRCRSSPT